MTDKEIRKTILQLSSGLSEDWIEWLKNVAWNLARVTGKYDRISINSGLSLKERLLLSCFELEEMKKWRIEMKIEHEKFMREHNDYLRSRKKDQDSISIKYPFPIGEA